MSMKNKLGGQNTARLLRNKKINNKDKTNQLSSYTIDDMSEAYYSGHRSGVMQEAGLEGSRTFEDWLLWWSKLNNKI